MPFIFVEELGEGQTEAEVMSIEDYNSVIEERDSVIAQRDEAITRAETAEADLRSQKEKYAKAFFASGEAAKSWQNNDVRKDGEVQTFAQLFAGRTSTGA